MHVDSGKDIASGTFEPAGSSQLDHFYAYDLGSNIGVTVAAADFEGTGKADLLTGATTAPHYRVVKGNASGVLPPALFEGSPADLQGGIAVGA